MPTCKAVIFDMDGLLLDTERISYPIWKRVFEESGYSFDHNIYVDSIGKDIPNAEKHFKSIYGPDFPYLELRKKRIRYVEDHIQKQGIAIRPGGLALINFLDSKKVPRALATSTGYRRVLEVLEIAGLKSCFENIVAGDQVSKGKPDPEIFRSAAKLIKTEPHHCVVLEDSPTGIYAASAAGTIPVMVPDLATPSEEVRNCCYKICNSLYEAKEIIGQLL